MRPADDNTLLREYLDNASGEAFAALVARHINLVYSVALRRTGNPHQAEEITQAVFILLAQKAPRLRHDRALSSWLFQAAGFTANNFLRSESRRQHREQEAYMQISVESTESEAWRGIAPLLDIAVASLNEKDRRAIVLRFYENKTLEEVGLALNANGIAAKKRVQRALEKLRHHLVKQGASSHPASLAELISAHAVHIAPVGLAKTISAVAVAKGVTASSSTLTLLKGSLKLMTWTKTKIVVAIGGTAVLLLASLAVTTLHHSTASAQSAQPRTISLQELVDAGHDTPEAAWETRYWARAQGDYDAVIAATDTQAVATAKAWMGDKATFHDRSQADFASFKGIQIAARKDLACDRVELKYCFAFDDRPQTKIVLMVKVNDAWICRETRPYDTRWDVGSQPEL